MNLKIGDLIKYKIEIKTNFKKLNIRILVISSVVIIIVLIAYFVPNYYRYKELQINATDYGITIEDKVFVSNKYLSEKYKKYNNQINNMSVVDEDGGLTEEESKQSLENVITSLEEEKVRLEKDIEEADARTKEKGYQGINDGNIIDNATRRIGEINEKLVYYEQLKKNI